MGIHIYITLSAICYENEILVKDVSAVFVVWSLYISLDTRNACTYLLFFVETILSTYEAHQLYGSMVALRYKICGFIEL